MRIESLEIVNVLGISEIAIDDMKPAMMFCGANGAGKSSVIEAVRMALEGASVRVAKKKDYAALVHGDAKTGSVKIGIDGETRSINLPSGKGFQSVGSEYLPLVLEPSRFAAGSAADRRTTLFGVMGVKTKADDIRDRLVKRGHDDERIRAVMPYVRAGFAEGEKEAAARATEKKGEWKAITGGETWGAVKAESWEASKPAGIDPGKLSEARADLAKIDAEIEADNIRLGEANATARAAKEAASRLDSLRERAGQRHRIAEKLERDRAELKTWQTKVETAREQAGVKPAQNTAPTPCPHCGGLLSLRAGTAEIWHEETVPHYDAEVAAALPGYERAVATLENSVKNGERDITLAEAAAVELEEAEAMVKEAAPDTDAIAQRIHALKHSRANQDAAIRLLEEAERAAATAAGNTAKAKAAHAEIMAWNAVAESLSPAGIPADMLRESLAPFNDTLARNAQSAGWFAPVVADDMSIATDTGRPYALLSESERWRMDAILAAAISEHAGIKLLVFDRFDVLDLPARAGLVAWIKGEIDAGRVESALIAGTLKAAPSGLPDAFDSVWVERGTAWNARVAA